MLLGKRPRPPMKRTTSMTEFTADLGLPGSGQPSNHERAQHHQMGRSVALQGDVEELAASRYVAAVVTHRGGARRNSMEFEAIETAPFLRACGLCKRHLSPGFDTFMYRGEIAFCSLECRQQQMNLDERKQKFLMKSTKKEASPATSKGESGETVAAA